MRSRAPVFDALTVVRPVRRQLGLRRLAAWSVRGLLLGGGISVLVLAVAHLIPVGAAVPVAIAAILLGLATGVMEGIHRWPAEIEAARTVDRHFGLHDRLTTALELRGSHAPLAIRQRQDAAQQLEGRPVERSTRGQVRGRETVAAGLALALALLLAVLPMPSAARHVQPTTPTQISLNHVAQSQIPAIANTLTSGLTPAARRDPAIHKLNLALAHLRFQLQHAHSRTAALRAISASQQQLRQIAASLHPIKPAAAAQLNRALAARMNAGERSQTRGSSTQGTVAAARTLNRLAAALSRMSASRKSALARLLAAEAGATSDASLRAQMRQAASSLGYRDPQSAAAALRQAAAALVHSPDEATAQSRLSRAGSSLETLKGQVSGLSRQTATQTNPGKAKSAVTAPGKKRRHGDGSNSGITQGRGSGSGSGTGKGSATGHGSGNGTGAGSKPGNGSGGSGGTGGHGLGGGRGGAGNHGTGRFGAHVYVPSGKLGAGPHTVQSGPTGAPLPGSSVPYQQVLGRYQQTARAALDQSSLPTSVQSYVRRYFTSISR